MKTTVETTWTSALAAYGGGLRSGSVHHWRMLIPHRTQIRPPWCRLPHESLLLPFRANSTNIYQSFYIVVVDRRVQVISDDLTVVRLSSPFSAFKS
jgi:hypothetical protein